MKALKFLSFVLTTLIFANCSSLHKAETIESRKVASAEGWSHCYKFDYDRQINKLYFIPYGQTANCVSDTFYTQTPYFHEMVDSEISEDGFTVGNAGTPQQIILNNGTRILATLWGFGGSYNKIRIFKPNFRNKNVALLCEFDNHSNQINVRQDDRGKILVYVRQPVSDSSDEFRVVAKECK